MNANLLNDLYFSFLPVKLNITFSLNGDDYPTENSNNNNNNNKLVGSCCCRSEERSVRSHLLGEYSRTSSLTTTRVNPFSIVEKFDCKAVNLNCNADIKSANYFHWYSLRVSALMIHSYKTPYRLCKNPFCLGHLIAFTTLSNGAQVYKPYGICARKKDYTDTMDILLNDVFSVVLPEDMRYSNS